MSEFDELYQETLLERAKSARRRGRLAPPCGCAQAYNPLCGDEVAFFARRAGGVVEAMRYEGQGCAISQASASMAAEAAEGRPESEGRAELERALAWIKGGGEKPEMEDWEALGGVSKFPMRVKCATMPIRAAIASLGAPDGAELEVGDEP